MQQWSVVPSSAEGHRFLGFVVAGSSIYKQRTNSGEFLGVIPFVEVDEVIGSHD